MNPSHSRYIAVVLAADRIPGDPVAEAAGVPCKSLVPVGNIPMVIRVLDGLAAAKEIGTCILCGPAKSIINEHAELSARISAGKIRWVENQATPSTSTYHVLRSLPDDALVLVTTADHALLGAHVVDYFCSEARKTGCDIVAGLAMHETVVAAYPDARRTATKLQDGNYCSCNLFAFLTPGGREVADFWRRIEKQRKKPLRVISVLGWIAVLRYLLGRLSLAEAQQRISRRLGLRAGAVILPYPEAAVDVDTVGDWKFVQTLIAKQTP